MVRLFGWLLSSALLCGIVGIVVVMMVVQHYSSDLPDINQLRNYSPPTVSRVHAGDGRLMAEFASEKRIFVPIERIPQRVIDAFLSAEDKNFYNHPGVDATGIARAIAINVQNLGRGRRPVGASTITQQVAKNFLLTNEVSVVRKIREAILSLRMEQAYTKDDILELYLNEIFLGQRAYGVAAASLAYFNKTMDELTVAEAAYLAALPKAPNNYSPTKNRDEAYARRNWVLGRMLEDNKINAAEYQSGLMEEIAIRPRNDSEYYRGGGYVTEEIRRELTARFGEKAVLEGGLLVRSTIDPRLQDIATQSLRDGLIQYDRRHGWRGPVTKLDPKQPLVKMLAQVPLPLGADDWKLAAITAVSDSAASLTLADGQTGSIAMSELKWARKWLPGQRIGGDVKRPSDVLAVGDVVLVEPLEGSKDSKAFALRQIPAVQGALIALDVNTGRVLAMVGGFSPQTSSFNRATQAQRQPGSSFKPFVYMAALEAGFTPSTLVLDAPISLPQGPGLPEWQPGNYSDDYLGPTTLRVGMEKSRNVMTVRLAQQVGIDSVAKLAEAFGVLKQMPRHLSMSLGAGETTVLKMTNAYAQIVNGGKQINPTIIDSIQDKSGRILLRHDSRPCTGCTNVSWQSVTQAGQAAPALPDLRAQLIDPRSAYQMAHILEGVIERGTGARAKGLPWPVAGKTGTTNDERDAWFIGFSADIAVGLYVGFDQPAHLGHKETGGSISAPIFKAFMEKALEGTPPVPFRVPSGLRMVRVDAQTGQLAISGDSKVIWEAFKRGTEPGSIGAPSSAIILGAPTGDGSAGQAPEIGIIVPPDANEGSTPALPTAPDATNSDNIY
jgi:penicillin-binding protein 1A